MRLKICSLIALFIFCFDLHAMTTESLVNRCKVTRQKYMSNDEMMSYMYCTGYISGYTQAVDELENAVDMNLKPIAKHKYLCLPVGAEISADELVLVFLKYTDDHPEQLHADASMVLHNAMVLAYPCNK